MINYNTRKRGLKIYARFRIKGKELTVHIPGVYPIHDHMWSDKFKRFKGGYGTQFEPKFQTFEKYLPKLVEVFNRTDEAPTSKKCGQVLRKLMDADMPKNKGIEAVLGEVCGQKERKSVDKRFQDFLAYKRKRNLSEISIKVLQRAFDRCKEWEEFQKNRGHEVQIFDPTTFNEEVKLSLESYFYEVRNFQPSFVNTILSRMRTFIIWDTGKKFPFFQLRKPIQNVVYLLPEEIGILLTADLTGWRKHTRDLYLWLCFTGQRYGDSQFIDLTEGYNKVHDYVQRKTGKPAMIPIIGQADRILQEYEGKVPRISNQKFNVFLKELFRELGLDRMVKVVVYNKKKAEQTHQPLYRIVSSHTGRKTFVMTCLHEGLPFKDIMDMTGHSSFQSLVPYMTADAKRVKNAGITLEARINQYASLSFEDELRKREDDIFDHNMDKYGDEDDEDFLGFDPDEEDEDF